MRRQDKYPDSKWFTYHNINPKNRITGDCVIRALTGAFQAVGMPVDYEFTLRQLVEVSLETGYSVCSKECVERYLKPNFDKQKQPRKTDNTKYTGKEFCEKFSTGVYICFIGGHHVTVIINGKIHDIWDCSNKTIGNYWKIK